MLAIENHKKQIITKKSRKTPDPSLRIIQITHFNEHRDHI